jgi:hypothetical protein
MTTMAAPNATAQPCHEAYEILLQRYQSMPTGDRSVLLFRPCLPHAEALGSDGAIHRASRRGDICERLCGFPVTNTNDNLQPRSLAILAARETCRHAVAADCAIWSFLTIDSVNDYMPV